MLENIYPIYENEFIIGRNKRIHAIVRQGHKNLGLLEYNSRELVTVNVSIYADRIKLQPLNIF